MVYATSYTDGLEVAYATSYTDGPSPPLMACLPPCLLACLVVLSPLTRILYNALINDAILHHEL